MTATTEAGNGQPVAPPHVDHGRIVGSDPSAPRQMTTGELRFRLQRVIHVRLTSPVRGLDDQDHFGAGTVVACQYWGNGLVGISPVHLEGGPPIMALATSIRQPVLYS